MWGEMRSNEKDEFPRNQLLKQTRQVKKVEAPGIEPGAKKSKHLKDKRKRKA